MDELVIRFFQGHASSEESARVHAWRKESPGNEALFRDLEMIWTGLSKPTLVRPVPAATEVIELAEQPQVLPLGPARTRRRRAWVAGVAIAAAIASLVLINGNSVRRHFAPHDQVLQTAELVTDQYTSAMTHLSDGTIVHLAPNSRLLASPVPGRREVLLEGKAFFGVASHGEDWPFVVRSDFGDAQVLGTRFEFSTENDEARVVVVDGRVSFSSAGEDVEVAAGQMSVAQGDGQPRVEAVVNIDQFLDWMGRSLVFHNTPLAQAAIEIEKRFGAEIEVASEALSRRTISGGFKDETFSQVMTTICRVINADCVIENNRAVIRPKIQ